MMINDFCTNCFEKKNKPGKCPVCGYDDSIEHDSNGYLLPGTILDGKYMVGKVLGHGGFGITYLGTDLSIQTKIAIKEYMPSGIAHRDVDKISMRTYKGDKGQQYTLGFTRFIKEAKVLSRFNAVTSIVSVYDVFKANGTAYIIMEYLEGETLSNYLKEKGPLSSKEVMNLILPVLDSLEKVHMANIIHRDIALDNLYLLKDGSIKLLDFGAARYAFAEKAKSLSIVLKPGYAPIEQYSRRGAQGPWTDIYALAASMYAMLTGEAPPDATDRIAGIEIEYPKQIDSHMKKVLSKALNVSGRDRYQSISEFRNALTKSKEKNKSKESSIDFDKQKNNSKDIKNYNLDSLVFDKGEDSVRSVDSQEHIPQNAQGSNGGIKKLLFNKKLVTVFAVAAVVIIGLVAAIIALTGNNDKPVNISAPSETVSTETETQSNGTGDINQPDTLSADQSDTSAVDYAEFNFVLWGYLDGIIIDLNTNIENEKLQVIYSIDGGEWKEARELYVRDGFSLSATYIEEHRPQSACDIKVVDIDDHSIVYDTYHIDPVDLDTSSVPTLKVIGATANSITVEYDGVENADKIGLLLYDTMDSEENLTYVYDDSGTFTYTLDGNNNQLQPGVKYRVAVMYEFWEYEIPYIYECFSVEVQLPKNNNSDSMYMVDGKTYNVNMTTEGSLFFREPLIEEAVRYELGVDDDYIITEEDLLSIEQLLIYGTTPFDSVYQYEGEMFEFFVFIGGIYNSQQGNITNLDDIAKLKNLKVLVLDRQQITDISPIADLDLEILMLDANGITDISPIENMTSLNKLTISNNNVKDLSPISNLGHFKYINISSNPITDISPLAGVSISEIMMTEVPLEDYSPLLAVKSLETFTGSAIPDSGMESVKDINTLKNLSIFQANHNAMDYIKEMDFLQSLSLSDSDFLADISGVENLTNLKILQIFNTNITSIEPAKGLPWLTDFEIFNLDLEDLELVLDMPSLRRVMLDSSQIEELKKITDVLPFEVTDPHAPTE